MSNLNILSDVPMLVTAELGRTKLKIKNILQLGEGSVIELDKLSGEPVNILVNGKVIAKGEVVVIDENFGVRITEIKEEKENLIDLFDEASIDSNIKEEKKSKKEGKK